MRSTNGMKETIKQWLNVTASPETRARIWRKILLVQEQSAKAKSVFVQPNIWRTIMKSPITKLTATTVILITAVILMTFLDKAAIPLYALEQTIQANHTIKTIHLRMFKDVESIENNEFSDYWIKYDNAGKLSNLRCNEHDVDGVSFTVWNDGVSKTWIPENNVVIIIRENNTEKEFEDFAKEFDPKLTFQRLYDMSMEEEEIELNINNPAEDSNSIYVKATHSGCKERADLVVDRQTKLMKKFSKYCLKDQEYKLDMRIEFLAYNKTIDMSVFQLSGIPDDALVYDQVNQLVGLKKGDLTNEEIAAMVVREALKATIAKDYDEVSRLMEGDPGDAIEEFIKEEFKAELVRIISTGRPEPHEKLRHVLCVPCKVVVENEEKGKWMVNIIAMAKPIGYQPGNRWIMHADLLVSESHMPSKSVFDAQDRIEGNLIVPNVGIGEFTLGMSKDEILRKLGEPKGIFFGGERYTLDNLPRQYFLFFGDISFWIYDDSVIEITALNPLYKFNNGLGVGDSEDKIRQAFGDNYQFEEGRGIDFLNYEDKGLHFEIRKNDRTVMEIGIRRTKGNHSDTPQSDKAITISEQPPGPITFPKIDRRPKPEEWGRGEMKSLPKYDPDSDNPFQMDLRCRDLSKLDLTNSIDDLLYATFDDRTVWPASDKMPHDFTWQKFMELGKNPGLGIRSLHKEGTTGRGVSIAILDQPLLVDHQEYAERLRLYEEIHIQSGEGPAMHGPAVASIAVGKTVGVAPEAELYYIAQWNFDWEKEHAPTLRYLAQGIHRILEVNELLPKDKKIRVISISKGWTRSHKEYRLITEAAQKARAAGMLVVCTSIDLVHNGFDFGGLGRSPLADPDVFESYNAGLFMDRAFRGNVFSFPEGNIWVPMDSRTTASPTGCDEYVFYRQGGFSWAVPYIAGVYALAVQVEPDITPERFWALAMKTGRTIELEHKGQKRSFGPIIDPVRLIRSISGDVKLSQQVPSKHTIVPGLRIGDYTLGMSKDEVLKELGEPEAIYLDEDGDDVVRRGEERYDLNNLPSEYLMAFGDVSFGIEDDSVNVIFMRSPLYELSNGLKVGDSEQKVKQAFGKDFKLEEALGKDFHCYHGRGLAFQIRKKSQTIAEIVVYKPESDHGAPDQQEISERTIVPGLRVGEYTLGMSKDDVLRRLGEPENIFYEGERYTLDNLPRTYYMSFGDISFCIDGDVVIGIGVHSPVYKFTNGLKVGDSEQKVKKVFGNNFRIRESEWKDFLSYKDEGLMFEIHKQDRTVMEIGISRTRGGRGERDAPEQQEQSKHTIVPGVRVGVYTFGMSKGEVLRKLGEPDSIQLEEDEVIHRGDPKYSLNNLPSDCILAFGDISFLIKDDSVKAIFIRSRLYKLSNGLKVGDSEQKIKQAFGEDFHLEESLGKDYLCYDAKWLAFEINKKNQTIAEIVTFQPKVDRPDSAQVALVRKAASEGRILYKVTTPDEFKEIAGRPTREWADGDDVIYMEYPGIEVKFVCRGNSPYVVIYVLCNRMGIDIGQDRPIDERDLDQQPDRSDSDAPDQQEKSKHTIVPGLSVGEYTLGMSKDDVLNEFGEPKAIQLGEDKDDFVRRGEEKYNLNNLPNQYILYFDKISFWFEDDSVGAIGVHSPSYKLRSGLGVGDTKQKVRQTFGEDYNIKELLGNNYLCYRAEGIAFQIHKRSQTISEIVIAHPEGERTEGKRDVPDQREKLKHTIVPGVGVGNYMLGMSKQVLNKLGEPEGLSFAIDDDSVRGITVHSPLYKFTNGLGVGDSEQEIKQAFGDDFNLKDAGGIKDFLAYEDKGLMFEIHKGNRTVMEINVYQPKGDRDDPDKPDRREPSKYTIIPGLRVGEYTLGMSKEEVMKKLGEPEHIHLGGEQYTLDNLPRRYIISFGDISFGIEDDTVTGISARSPLYKFANGLGVGNSEEEIKRAFGNDFELGEYGWKNQLNYEDKGIQFEIRNRDKTVIEIDVYPAKHDHEEGKNDTSDINQKIAQICSGPTDFNDVIRIFGKPSDYKWSGQSFKLEDLPVERYWIWYPDSIHVFMRWDKVDMLEIVDSAYFFNGKIPMGSSLESVLSIVGQPKETVVGQQGWEDGVLYKDINGRFGWCQYRREDLNADFRFLNNTLKCVHILEINSSSATAGRAAKRGDFKTVKTIRSVNEFEDVRSKDLSKFDLSSSKGLIATLSFNQQTVWPEQNKMPTGSGPQKILADAMNPGLGVRKLHQQGITGKGVNVAIIDQPLLPDHPEYDGKIAAYYDTGCGPSKSSMHGPAVASLLVGTNCGTAPDARVYYAAAPSWKADAAYYAKGLDWIIEQNEKLPNGEKIRVVSVSAAPSGPGSPFKKNREMWDQACGRAKADGIMVLDCTNSHRGFINRGWYHPGDPESVIKFNPGPPPKRELRVDPTEMSIYVPSSCRTTAQHYDYHGRNSYIYWGRGGLSWSIPYCAGVLAMGWQIHPDLTPAQMKEMLFASAYVHKSGARIINPRGFIEALKRLR